MISKNEIMISTYTIQNDTLKCVLPKMLRNQEQLIELNKPTIKTIKNKWNHIKLM